MTLEEYKKSVLGTSVEFHSYGTGAQNQCTDLVNQYIHDCLDTATKDYTEIIGTNAKDFARKYDPLDFRWIENTPLAVPQKGDIIVWNGNVGGGAGHVAIFLEGNIASFKSLDQNWSTTQSVTLEFHSYINVSGWLRPIKRLEFDDNILVGKKLYEKLVNGSTVRKELAIWIKDEQGGSGFDNPDNTSLENFKSYILGVKSRATDLSNQLRDKVVELNNRIEQVSRKKKEVLDLKLQINSLTNQLKKSGNANAESLKVLQGQLLEKQEVIEGLSKNKGELNHKIKELESEILKIKEKAVLGLSFVDLLILIRKKIVGR